MHTDQKTIFKYFNYVLKNVDSHSDFFLKKVLIESDLDPDSNDESREYFFDIVEDVSNFGTREYLLERTSKSHTYCLTEKGREVQKVGNYEKYIKKQNRTKIDGYKLAAIIGTFLFGTLNLVQRDISNSKTEKINNLETELNLNESEILKLKSENDSLKKLKRGLTKNKTH